MVSAPDASGYLRWLTDEAHVDVLRGDLGRFFPQKPEAPLGLVPWDIAPVVGRPRRKGGRGVHDRG